LPDTNRRGRRLVHGRRCGSRREALRRRPGERPAGSDGLRAVCVSAGAEHRGDHPHVGRSASVTAAAARRPFAHRIPISRVFNVSTGRRPAPAVVLAVRTLRLGFRHDRHRRPASGGRQASTASCRIRCRSRTQEIGVPEWPSAAGRRDVLKLVMGSGLLLCGVRHRHRARPRTARDDGGAAAAVSRESVRSGDLRRRRALCCFWCRFSRVGSPLARAMRVEPVVALRGE